MNSFPFPTNLLFLNKVNNELSFAFLFLVISVLKQAIISLNSLNLTILVSSDNSYIMLPNENPLYLNIRIFPSLVCVNAIYKYTCSGCSAPYYDKTSRNLKIRYCEYLRINKSGGNRASPSSSSILDHIISSNPVVVAH